MELKKKKFFFGETFLLSICSVHQKELKDEGLLKIKDFLSKLPKRIFPKQIDKRMLNNYQNGTEACILSKSFLLLKSLKNLFNVTQKSRLKYINLNNYKIWPWRHSLALVT